MISTRHRRNLEQKLSYATSTIFEQLFAAQADDYFRLSLQLTADAQKAECCLILAMNDCLRSNTIFSDFANVWARRMIIRNAIQLVLSRRQNSASQTEAALCPQSDEAQKERQLQSDGVLSLPDLERMAFVIVVLERLAILDCALLLESSPKDVNDAILRATNRFGLQATENPTDSLRVQVVESVSTVTTLDTSSVEPSIKCCSFCAD